MCSGETWRNLQSALLFFDPVPVPLLLFFLYGSPEVKGATESSRANLITITSFFWTSIEKLKKKVLREILELPFTPGMFIYLNIYIFIYMSHISKKSQSKNTITLTPSWLHPLISVASSSTFSSVTRCLSPLPPRKMFARRENVHECLQRPPTSKRKQHLR